MNVSKKGQLNIFFSASILILGAMATVMASLGFALNNKTLVWAGAVLFGIASLFITLYEGVGG